MQQLTPREIEILTEVCTGKPYKIIANKLNIKQTTLTSHLKSICQKLQVKGQVQLVRAAFQYKLVDFN